MAPMCDSCLHGRGGAATSLDAAVVPHHHDLGTRVRRRRDSPHESPRSPSGDGGPDDRNVADTVHAEALRTPSCRHRRHRTGTVRTDAHVTAVDAGAGVREAPSTFVSGDRFASIRDPFGVRWSVMTRVEDLSEEESARRVATWAASFAAE